MTTSSLRGTPNTPNTQDFASNGIFPQAKNPLKFFKTFSRNYFPSLRTPISLSTKILDFANLLSKIFKSRISLPRNKIIIISLSTRMIEALDVKDNIIIEDIVIELPLLLLLQIQDLFLQPLLLFLQSLLWMMRFLFLRLLLFLLPLLLLFLSHQKKKFSEEEEELCALSVMNSVFITDKLAPKEEPFLSEIFNRYIKYINQLKKY
jgi:hypothetical protein